MSAFRREVRVVFGLSESGATRMAVAVSCVIGFLLRLRGASGELWLDELWTLRLISPAQSVQDIFFNTPHANNHYLNSLWLWLVGPDASVLAMRACAIALGTLSIIAAAAASARQGRVACALAAAMFATSYFFVHYGSEARGYAGMALCVLIAKSALDVLVGPRPPGIAWWIFGAAIFVGGFFNVTMAASAAALAGAGLAQMFDEGRLRHGLSIGVVSACASLPFIAVFAINMADPNFKIGNVDPFSFAAISSGLGGAARATLGFPDRMSNAACILASVALAIPCLVAVPRTRRFFPVVAIFVMPTLFILLQAPTQGYPRFQMVSAIGLLLLTSEAMAALLLRGGLRRTLACLVLAAFGLGQAQALANFYQYSRGHYVDAVKFMTADGPATYVGAWKGETNLVVAYATRRDPAALTEVPIDKLCEQAPDWLIFSTYVDNPELPEATQTLTGPQARCARQFVLASRFAAWGLSGINWWIYRRAE